MRALVQFVERDLVHPTRGGALAGALEPERLRDARGELRREPFQLARRHSGGSALPLITPYSRSLRANVGREMPRIRAAALRFPPVISSVASTASRSTIASAFPSGGITIS